MRIVCIGGGPAGLYFALLMKQLNPAHRITVVERNKPYDTFGWGVVFSDATLDNMRRWDGPTADAIEVAFNHWDDIELHFQGQRIRSGGHGFVGIGRKKLLNILQQRCEDLGVELVFETEATSDADFPDADLIIASDGVNSRIRQQHAAIFQPDVVTRPNRFIWLGTTKLFDAFNFLFEKTEHGWFQAHVYKFDDSTTTFIVETPEDVWRAHGLEQAGPEESIAFCERLFARHLQGHQLMSNARHLRGSAWINFQRVRCRQWHHFNGQSHVVLMGDAVHTAHFAIGSGTKLALEDAIELTRLFRDIGADIPAVLARYQAEREVDVLRLQNAAWNAMEWFEVVGRRYCEQLPPPQFMYSMLTRSQRISHENLRLRDAAWLEGYERWFAQQAGLSIAEGEKPPSPMFTPFTVRGLTVPNRVVVSPMAMYSAQDGLPGDFHLVHFGARALGGAGLIYTEMLAPSADARITPGCAGLWNDAQAAAWQRIVAFVHGHSGAKMGVQLGHAGRKGSTQLGWQQMDEPLPEGNWPLISASPIAYGPNSQLPREMGGADMAQVTADFVAATRRAADAGFDILELHCAHGYLLSSFLSPLTNHRTDAYGGSVENRARYPLEVFAAVRAAWPAERPISVRLSCHDWFPGGNTADEAVAFAALFKAAGADLIDCSSGQVVREQKPVYGRMWQTPFADRIRNEVGIATVAVGSIFEADHVNMVIAAGRADLCAVARPHLADPAWTLHEAAKIGHSAQPWPPQYLSGRAQYQANLKKSPA
ncbi:bifunctional salicylyl-CoA 5-hydroxylase/oxidoreductase [Rubrivivax rivuli]|uniref:Bifunctional salicylyl-CoA 5-hydroxylase/oxidoreductase n=1 Tax=Rubrivivax rivuli TaxID=1862385 RepID=A0A437REE9_9BURK|nr:bifunctional salicylyl-CoA 5-hydroxylase/oxidoreductase [Rubrivivax rivuli]RVU45137.1 bifunctional salicylyl-CoA 5-hydroxylase/oxidoreductase [Rubrivivax rivuli]